MGWLIMMHELEMGEGRRHEMRRQRCSPQHGGDWPWGRQGAACSRAE